MVRYILRTVYNSVFRHDESPGGSCNQYRWRFRSILSHLNTNIRHYARLAILAVLGVCMFKGTSNGYNILFCDFLFHGYPCMTKKNVML